MAQVTIGWQLGGQSYSQLIMFKNKDVYVSFTRGQFEFGADATVVALTYGAQADYRAHPGHEQSTAFV